MNYPEIELEQLQIDCVAQKDLIINWTASDRNDDSLKYSVSYWNNETWIPIISNLTEMNYVWNTKTAKNGDFYKIRVEASDG